MPFVNINGVEIELDEDGFIVDYEQWNEDLAKYFALQENIEELTEDHWRVINFLRDYYKQHQVAPMIRKLCNGSGFSLKQIYELFPTGPAKGACKIAGLPRPAGCV